MNRNVSKRQFSRWDTSDNDKTHLTKTSEGFETTASMSGLRGGSNDWGSWQPTSDWQRV